MSLTPIQELPDDSRVWCFGASRPLSGAETAHGLDGLAGFLGQWTAHEQALRAGFDLRYQRFVLVAVDEGRAGASGCSIDALTGYLRRLEMELGVTLLDATPVWYRDAEGRIQSCARDRFRQLAAEGVVDQDTIVFDLTVTRLHQVRDREWEVPAATSWHASLLAGRPAAH